MVAPFDLEFDDHERRVRAVYGLLVEEVDSAGYGPEELVLMRDPDFYYGRYLDPATRPYWEHAVAVNVARAIEHFELDAGAPRRIVDLGCGLGMQSIIFASLGASVLALDLDPRCVELGRKRRAWYEARLGRPLDIRFEAGDFVDMDLSSYRDFDALFSMSAFAHIRPLERTVNRIAGLLKPSARVCLWDQNPEFLFKELWRGNEDGLATTRQIEQALRAEGFTQLQTLGGNAIPRQLWGPRGLHRAIGAADRVLGRIGRLSMSYLVLAAR